MELNIKSIAFLLFCIVILSSCMSIATLVEDEKFNEPDTCPEDCTIYRIYSGTSTDICLLRLDNAGQAGAIAFWDLPFSLVVDTLVLPYTIYKQVTVGGSFSEPTGKESKCKNT